VYPIFNWLRNTSTQWTVREYATLCISMPMSLTARLLTYDTPRARCCFQSRRRDSKPRTSRHAFTTSARSVWALLISQYITGYGEKRSGTPQLARFTIVSLCGVNFKDAQHPTALTQSTRMSSSMYLTTARPLPGATELLAHTVRPEFHALAARQKWVRRRRAGELS